ncbi:hypothetical protein TNCV_1961831 [Trichonephila clavipes]|nr:hypothetical protein TNCV_1961831 [Trichonephila clavipes]
MAEAAESPPNGDAENNAPETESQVFKIPKSNAQRGKEFCERKKKLAASPVEKVTKNSANSSSASAKSPSEYMREDRAQEKKALENTLFNAQFKGWKCY